MEYVIKNNKELYIRINEEGRPVTCSEADKTLLTYQKAKNIISSLPKKLKKFNFKVEAILDVPTRKDKNENRKDLVTLHKEYEVSDEIVQWVNKFGICDDILQEAQKRKDELNNILSNTDKELSNELHKIELEKSKNACDGFKVYKKIKAILENRRRTKDELLIVSNVLRMDFRNLNREVINKAVLGLASRKFTMRVVDDEELNDT